MSKFKKKTFYPKHTKKPKSPQFTLSTLDQEVFAARTFITSDIAKAEKKLLEIHHAHPANIACLEALRHLFSEQDNPIALLNTLSLLRRQRQLSHDESLTFSNLLPRITFADFTPQLIDDLCQLLDSTGINLNNLSAPLVQYLNSRYRADQPTPSVNLNDMGLDPLLLKGLRKVHFINPGCERLFTAIRKALLLVATQNLTLNTNLTNLIKALALHNYLNEYVYFIDSAEKALLKQLEELIQSQLTQSWQPSASTAPLLILSLYGTLYDLPFKDALLKHPIDQWPDALKDIATETLFNIDQEIKLAASITPLNAIQNIVSLEVQQHYETNPYPRWQQLAYKPFSSISHYIRTSRPEALLPSRLSQQHNHILIAGCGTGKQALQVALCLPNSSVTAIDISRRSLAYGMIKAKQYGASNLRFNHCDILDVGLLNQKFDYIECSGVLHHMGNPSEGLKALRAVLENEGVMKIALYSETARQAIQAEREKISKLGLEPDPNNIRLYRQAMLASKERSSIVYMFHDFYNLSECRDLLFHQHEQCYTIPKINALLSENGMHFMLLDPKPHMSRLYKERYPSSHPRDELANWQTLEKDNPYLFAGMYSFWCVPVS